MLGAYHGLNPAMGWLFAVSSGMQARRASGVFMALPPIALGHLLAMAAALLPFVLVRVYVERLSTIRLIAGGILILFGLYKLASPRHPRLLARVGPSQLTLWSFLMATAHGAGLMLVPVVLGLYGHDGHAHGSHASVLAHARGDLAIALLAVTVHTAAMVVAGGALAWVVYRYAGLALLRRSWLNLDLLWAVLLLVAGGIALAGALA